MSTPTPEWVEQWDSDHEWAWRRRHELHAFAIKLLSYGPIQIGTSDTGVRTATPRDVMNNCARMNERTWVIWRNRLDKAEPPPSKPPKQERKKTPVPTPKYPPLSPARIDDLVALVDSIYGCLPDADDKLRNLLSEFKIRNMFGKPTAAIEKSMWATIRTLGDEAERRYDAMNVPEKKRVLYRQYYTTVFERLNAALREEKKQEFLRGA